MAKPARQTTLSLSLMDAKFSNVIKNQQTQALSVTTRNLLVVFRFQSTHRLSTTHMAAALTVLARLLAQQHREQDCSNSPI